MQGQGKAKKGKEPTAQDKYNDSMPSKQTGEKATHEEAQDKDSDSIRNGSSSISTAETVSEVSNDQVNVHRELMALLFEEPPSPLRPAEY
jgi:hypothetical protein